MTTWAIIPLKRLEEAKSSLSRALNPHQRKNLVLHMLSRVIEAVQQARGMAGVIVVSPDQRALELARGKGALALKEPGLKLNQALELAIDKALSLGATSILILPSDIPLLKPQDVENMLTMASSGPGVILAPSKDWGTNALFLKPPRAMSLRFGGRSFWTHLTEAKRRGLKVKIYRSPTVEKDVDEEQDLKALAGELGLKHEDEAEQEVSSKQQQDPATNHH